MRKKTKKTAAKPPPTTARNAANYRRLHWGQHGDRPAESLRAAELSRGEELTLLGDLVSVTYRTEKGADGPSDYEHRFATPRPRLAVTAGGLLVIAGGGYDVTERGIVG